ncbi:putative thymic stromal cotransporter -like [Scophthalmus maximus]|uniref:Putative thymic stromal cotransporter-like n=1 Tax=Scophthalmus maximus TaxID=52904 RepID=A0A2U9CFQ3_SCOMX|nr:thymic stromal cotransporter homolog [Scophthalmus maximus]AWP15043.1 putative thymic stromal cotransporter -like [Scophthalmus maximus]
MALPNLCQSASALLRRVEPIIVLEQLGSSLFDTALQLVVKDRCANATSPDLPAEESRQKAMTDFFMTYNLIIRLVPILPALLLARLSDRGWRKAPIVAPLCGYLLSRLALLLVVVGRLPLQVMFGAAVLFELTGGFCAYWPGVMTLASLGSTATDRSKVMMRVELLYGLAGLVGSLSSGHLFLVFSTSVGHGVVLLIVSTLLHLFILIHSIVLLQVKEVSSSETCHILSPAPDDDGAAAVAEAPTGINMVNVVLLFAAAFLYDFAVGGAMEILGVFVMKEPLSWSASQVGYGNAAGSTIFLTSFLGVMLFRRCAVSDVAIILIGMLSFALGIYFMSFVTATYMFYLARSLNMFALIPTPIIRSLLSQQVPSTSYGTVLTSLQLAMKFAGLAYIPAFTKIYQGTLVWFPGFVFTLSSVFSVLGMIPISIVGCRAPPRRRGKYILGD